MTDARRERAKVVISKLFDREPPQAIEAEAAVIGSILIDYECWPRAAAIVQPKDFYRQAHAAIYETAIDMCASGAKLDMVLLNQRLKDKGLLDAVGGVEYLLTLAESVPTSASVGYYAGIVLEKAKLRRLIESLGLSLHDCYHSTDDAADVVASALNRILSIDGADSRAEIVERADVIQEVYAEIEARAEMPNPPPLGVPTGIAELDRLLVGVEDGTFTMIGARTSDGKTALAMQVAESFASHGKRPLVFCLEMSRKQLGYRDLASGSGVSNFELRHARNLTMDNWQALAKAAGRANRYPIDFAVTPGLTVAKLRTITTQRVRALKCGAVFIDHIGLMRAPQAENRNLALGEITREIKGLALDLMIPVVGLCQLNRDAAKDNRAPQLSDFRESGHIEEDVDNAILIYRPEKELRTQPGYTPLPGQELEPAQLLVRKNRQGPLGVVEVFFDGATMTFKDKYRDQVAGRVA